MVERRAEDVGSGRKQDNYTPEAAPVIRAHPGNSVIISQSEYSVSRPCLVINLFTQLRNTLCIVLRGDLLDRDWQIHTRAS
jgi:hypothetical protein